MFQTNKLMLKANREHTHNYSEEETWLRHFQNQKPCDNNQSHSLVIDRSALTLSKQTPTSVNAFAKRQTKPNITGLVRTKLERFNGFRGYKTKQTHAFKC